MCYYEGVRTRLIVDESSSEGRSQRRLHHLGPVQDWRHHEAPPHTRSHNHTRSLSRPRGIHNADTRIISYRHRHKAVHHVFIPYNNCIACVACLLHNHCMAANCLELLTSYQLPCLFDNNIIALRLVCIHYYVCMDVTLFCLV